MASGFVSGCASLTALSYAVAGSDWPSQMAAVIKTSTIEKQYLLPNIRGVLQPFTASLLPEVVLGGLLAGFIYRLISRSGFEYGMCAVIVGSL